MPDTADVRPLLERCKQQDRAAFAEVFERYHDRVFHSAYVVTRRPEAADDVTQLVFVELYTALRRYDLDRPFLPWLYRIVHNVSVDYLKRNRRGGETTPAMDAQLETLMGPDPAPSPADHVEQAELRRTIWRAMGNLSADQRAVLMLCYYADLHEHEMATALHVRPGTVKSRLHRARQALRTELAHHDRALAAEYTRRASDGVQITEPAQGGSE